MCVPHPIQTLYTAYGLSRLFEIDRKTVLNRLQKAGIEPAAERDGNPIYRVREVAAWLAPLRPASQNLQISPRDQAYLEQALHTRRKREQLEGKLIWAEDCRFHMGEIAKIVTAALSTLPDALERDTGLTAEQYEVVEKVLDAVREELATRVYQDSFQSTTEDILHEISG